MDKPIENYQNIRLEELKKTLEANNFAVYIAANRDKAKTIILEDILPRTEARSISWGGSMTFISSGLYKELKNKPDLKVIDTYDQQLSAEESLERRRQSLLVDLFFTGTNAITESGLLVNLDMFGNRIGGLTFGPKHVVVLAGQNKIVPDLEDAMTRIKNYVAPINAMRLDKKNPCTKTGICTECNSLDRICNTWTITEKSFPKGRIKIVLIKENMGL